MRIDGIAEDAGESWDNTESKCLSFFSTKLGLPSVQIERAHRVGPKKDGKTRTIIAKLRSYKDREIILNKTKEKCPQGIFINQDFSVRVSKIRKELRSHLQDLKAQGYDAFISFDRIRYWSDRPRNGGNMQNLHLDGHAAPKSGSGSGSGVGNVTNHP